MRNWDQIAWSLVFTSRSFTRSHAGHLRSVRLPRPDGAPLALPPRSSFPLFLLIVSLLRLSFAAAAALNSCVKRELDKEKFVNEVGRTIVVLARRIPRGVLVFLPSYSRLAEAVCAWRACEVSIVENKKKRNNILATRAFVHPCCLG